MNKQGSLYRAFLMLAPALVGVGIVLLILAAMPAEAEAQGCEKCEDRIFEDVCAFCSQGEEECMDECDYDVHGNCYIPDGTGECGEVFALLEDVESLDPSLLPEISGSLTIQKVTVDLSLAWNCSGKVVAYVRNDGSARMLEPIVGAKPEWILRREREYQARLALTS